MGHLLSLKETWDKWLRYLSEWMLAARLSAKYWSQSPGSAALVIPNGHPNSKPFYTKLHFPFPIKSSHFGNARSWLLVMLLAPLLDLSSSVYALSSSLSRSPLQFSPLMTQVSLDAAIQAPTLACPWGAGRLHHCCAHALVSTQAVTLACSGA